ncbi:MAG: hypothetical protein [Microviridae sp.]|nr:MAG: hypothetical protein [Microviridae sp.]
MILCNNVSSYINMLFWMKYYPKIYTFLQMCRRTLSAWPMPARCVKPICEPRISMMSWLISGSVKLTRSYTTWLIQVLTARKERQITAGDVRKGVRPLKNHLGLSGLERCSRNGRTLCG